MPHTKNQVVQTPNPNHAVATRKSKETILEIIKSWGTLNKEQLTTLVTKRNFIIDLWATLDDYKDLKLEGNWEVASTSLESNLPGTIFVKPTAKKEEAIFNKAVTQYLTNHGLTTAQADTFSKTYYFAKYRVLEFLVPVLNDQNLYMAYKDYKRKFTRQEYIAWLDRFPLNRHFNAKLDDIERHYLSCLILRMAGNDRKLAPIRRELKNARA